MSIQKIQKLFFHFLVVFVLIAGCNNDGFAEIQPPGLLKIGKALSTAAAQLDSGQSIKIATTDLYDLNHQDNNQISMWGNTGVWDAGRGRMIWIGKRNSSYPYHRLEYDEATNDWSEESLHSDLSATNSGHGYDCNAIDPTTGDIYFRKFSTLRTYHWTKATDTWDYLTDAPSSTSNAIAEAIEWWPDRGLVWSDVHGVKLWDGSSWSTLVADASVSGIGYHSFGEYQPNADVYVFGGGNAGPYKLYRIDADNNLTLLGAAPIRLGNNQDAGDGILVHDPSSDYYIAWNHSKAWYEFDAINDIWNPLTVCSGDGSTPCNGTPNFTSTSSIAVPISTYGVIAFVDGSSDNVWLYKHTANSDTNENNTGENTGSGLQSFALTSPLNGKVPFTVGLGFKEGDVLETPTIDLANYQIEVKRRWPDGSAKHAVVSGTYISNAWHPYNVNVFGSGTTPSGIDLTEADIIAAGPSATVQIGGYGTVYLSSLLSSPDRIWISGPEMVEAHYSSVVSYDPYIQVKFQVRLYSGGEVFVREIVENGNLDSTVSQDISYIPNLRIGGATVFNNGGSNLTQYAHTRYDVIGWINTTNPAVTVAQDTEYLMGSGLVPNYWKTNPSSAALNALDQSYTPLNRAGWTEKMGDTGFQPQIGLLPLWDALYVTSGGDSRAFAAMKNATRAINAYAIVRTDPDTGEAVVISDRPTYTVHGASAGGSSSVGAGSYIWDTAHHGSAGYLDYLVTGDYYALETMEFQATLCYLMTSYSSGSGTSRLLGGQDRSVAWKTRTIGQLAGIAPSNSIVDDVASLLAYQASYWTTKSAYFGQNLLGFLYSYQLATRAYGTGELAPWMHHFWVATYGYVSDLKPFSDMTVFNNIRNYFYKIPVGMLGENGTNNYCFNDAAMYNLKVADTQTSDTTTFYDSWGTVYEETMGSPNTSCANTLNGSSGATPSSAEHGYWGNLLPAIAYAVEDGATGAAEAWTRLTGATNWPDIETAGFDDVPIWGIRPRNK